MILLLDPSSNPVHIHVSSSDQVMQRLSQHCRFNNRVVAIVGVTRLCTFLTYACLLPRENDASVPSACFNPFSFAGKNEMLHLESAKSNKPRDR